MRNPKRVWFFVLAIFVLSALIVTVSAQDTDTPDDFSDPNLLAIAAAIFKWASDTDQPQLADLLAVPVGLDQVDLITSLAEEGNRKGNFQSNLSGALSYIREARQRQQLLRTAESLRRGESDLSDEQVNKLLAQVQSQLRTQNQRNPGIRV